MNHSPLNLLISKAIEGFNKYKIAEGLSLRSVDSYERVLKKWLAYQGDEPLEKIGSDDIRNYLAWLRTDYQPIRFNGKIHPLSPKTLRNIYIIFQAFFGWANQEFEINNPMLGIPSPKYKRAPVEAFTKEEVDLLVKACIFCKEAHTGWRRSFVMRRGTGARDQLIIFILLDTGLRASEFCSLSIGDVDLKTGKIEIKHGSEGGAKGGKGRTVFIGKATRKMLWRYLASREDSEDPDSPLILNREDRPFTPNSLRLLITRIGKRAKVKKAYPHKFRHTFAITYLRSGGDVFTLQALLGHSSLDMVQNYARISEVDIQHAHQKASPVDNWRL